MDDVITREAAGVMLTLAHVVIVTTGIAVAKAGIAPRAVLARRAALKVAALKVAALKVPVTKAVDAMTVVMVAAHVATALGAAAEAKVVRIRVGRSKGLAAIRMVGATHLAATRTADTISRVRIRALAARLGRIKVVAARDQPGSIATHLAQTRVASIVANTPRVGTCPQVAASIEATRPGLRVVCHRMTSAIASKGPKATAMVRALSVWNAAVNAAAVVDAGAVDAAVVAAAKAEIARAARWATPRRAVDPRPRLPPKPLRSHKRTAATNTVAAKANPAAAKATTVAARPNAAVLKASTVAMRVNKAAASVNAVGLKASPAGAKAHPRVRTSNRIHVMRARSNATRRRSPVNLQHHETQHRSSANLQLHVTQRRSSANLRHHSNQRGQRVNHSIRLSSGHRRLRRNTRIQPSRRDRASPDLNTRNMLSRSRPRPTSSRHHVQQQHPRQHRPVVASRAAELSRSWSGHQRRLASREAITSRGAHCAPAGARLTDGRRREGAAGEHSSRLPGAMGLFRPVALLS